jgi:hypothetical protein
MRLAGFRRAPAVQSRLPAGTAKNSFRGQIATNCDTTEFRRGKRPCEKARAAALSGQYREKTGTNTGKTPKIADFFRSFPAVLRGKIKKV